MKFRYIFSTKILPLHGIHAGWTRRAASSVLSVLAAITFLTYTPADAHPLTFNSTITYGASQTTGGADSISNWTGATFDAANIGGSGVNADGGANNGTTNDSSTYVANNQPIQGQTITTGNNSNGYDVASFTVRMAGYTNNIASGSNATAWNLNASNGPIIVSIGKVSSTTFVVQSLQYFMAGAAGNPGSSSSTNGPGTYLTFNLPFPVHLNPNTLYAFDLCIGNGSSNYFEWLGINTDVYAGGTAYNRSGTTITPLAGERVFLVNMTASAAPAPTFAHPGALNTQADLTRMTTKVAAGAQPWTADYNLLTASKYAQTSRTPAAVTTIIRGPSGSNYTRSQEDAVTIYQLALRYYISGDASYANQAVVIANAWAYTLTGIGGDSNYALAAGICGFQFACAGELLTGYPGWAATDKQAFKDMMMRVFYPANADFLWRHNDTFWREGGNTHYRLNWDTCNQSSMLAIGVLCDNRAVYQQAIDFFKNGPGNGRIERAAWYLHPDGTGQTEEMGRDQGHDFDGWDFMSRMCQVAWNQGDDLYAYDNNHVLRALEYVAKYNLGHDIPYIYHRDSQMTYSETWPSDAERGNFVPMYEMVYNHYVNEMGLAAPYSKLVADLMRPEPGPNTSIHPSQVDWMGFGTLTFTRDPIATGAVPGGLRANWSKNQLVLSWWGSAYATSYNIKRAISPSTSYTTIGTVNSLDTTYNDATAIAGITYNYVVSAVTPSGETANSSPLTVSQALVTNYSFEGTPNDSVGIRHATLQGGSTGLPTYASGKVGSQAISLDGVDDYVQLPVGTANYQDITVAAWVYWNGGSAWQRVFDFGNEVEQYLFLTPSSGSKMQFSITSTHGNEGTGILEGPIMAIGQWVHVAITLNGDTGTLYVNGVPVDTETIDKLDPLFGQSFCYLGKSMYNNDPLFSGRIDDFRIYNYALSGAEVWNLWGQSANHAPVFSSDPLNRPNATEDINYNTTSQTLTGSASDADGGTLTYSKANGPAWLTISANGALSGTPTNDDVGLNTFIVRVTDPSGATDDAVLWITVDNVNDIPIWNTNPLSKPSVSQNIPYIGTLSADAIDVDVGDTLTFSKISGPSWLTVASDGTLSGTPGSVNAGTNTFVVRATDNHATFADATLTITVLPNSLQSRYRLDGSAIDSVGGTTATISGTATYATGQVGQALSFDGTTNYVTLGSTLSNLIYQDITVAAWVYWNGGTAWQRIFDFGNDTSHYLFLSPLSSGNKMRFAIRNGGSEQDLDTTPLVIGQWVHVVVTLGGNTATIYLNGVAVATSSAITINPSDFTPVYNYIGKSQFSADPLFGGLIDDFRIYNYALSPSEVSSLASGALIPSGLAATTVGTNAVLSWNAATDALSYTLRRATTSGGPYTDIATGLTTTTFTDTTRTVNTIYYYMVTALGTGGDTGDSNELELVSGTATSTGFTPYSGLITIAQDGRLVIDSSSGTYASPITRSAGLTVQGGRLFSSTNNGANVSITGSSSGNTNDVFGPLTLSAGGFYGKVTTNAASNSLLTFSRLARNPGTQLNFARQGVGGATLASPAANTFNVVFSTPPGNTMLYGVQLVGGGGAAGTTTVSVLPFAFANIDLTTYDSIYGLRPLNTSTEMAALASGMTAGQNAKITSGTTTLGVDTTINSLWGSGGATAGTGALNITSGAIACTVSYSLGNATLAFGSAEGQIYVANSRVLTINSVITGSGGLTIGLENFNGNNASVILGGANTFTGVTTISGNNATLKAKLTNALALQNSTLDYNNYGASLQFGNGSTNVNAATLGGLRGAQNLALTNSGSGGGGVALTAGGDGDTTTYSGVLSGAGRFVKVGAGTLTLSGINTYTGTTTVSAGTLNVIGSLAVGSVVTVNTGGTLAGSGSINGATSVVAGGTLSPGNSGPGTLGVAALTLNGGSNLSCELGTLSDKLTLSGAYTAPASGTVTVNLSAAAGFAAGTYNLITGASGISSSSFTVGTAPAGYTYGFSASGGVLTVTVTSYTAIQAWRMANFGMIDNTGNAADTADPDADGSTNAQEFAAGTNPNDINSVLKVTAIHSNGNDMTLSFPGISGKVYRVERSDSLATGSWTPVLTNGVPADNIVGTNNSIQVIDTDGALQPKRFYHIVIVP